MKAASYPGKPNDVEVKINAENGMSPLVILSWEGPIAVLTLNRPERHNSLVPALLAELLSASAQVESHPQAGALVLQANGRSFSTGGDVAAFFDHEEDLEIYAAEIVGLLNQAILKLFELPLPTLAAVHGIVTGGSLGLVLACDLVLVTPQASFTPYYRAVGFSPDGGWTALLPAIIGPKRAAEVLLNDLTISAEQAVAWGLAFRIIPADNLRSEALRLAADMASGKSSSLQHIRSLLRADLGDLAARLEAERSHFVRQIATPEAWQGMTDFLRRPKKPRG